MCRMKGEDGEKIRGGALGLGLLVGGAVFSYGLSCGCTTAEILAINDDGGFPKHNRTHTHTHTHILAQTHAHICLGTLLD
jgi:hypothetical protein